MAQISSRNTYQTGTTETRLVRDVGAEMSYLEPDIAPLINVLNAINKKTGTDVPKFEWFEDDYVALWDQNSATTLNNNTASTSMTVVDGTKFSVGTLFIVPKVGSSSTAPELCLVTAKPSANAITVQRAVNGDSNVDTIGGSAYVRIVGSAYAEGSSRPDARMTNPSAKFGYVQIFRNVFEATGTQLASVTYATNNEWEREKTKKLKEHKRDINSSFLWSTASAAVSATSQFRTSAGLNSIISTNIKDAGGILTEKVFDDFAVQAFRYGADRKVLLSSPKVVSALTAFSRSRYQISQRETTFGVKVLQVETGIGVFDVIRDVMLENPSASSTNGFNGWAFALDPNEITIRFLNGNGKSRDTKYIEYTMENQNGVDKIVAEYFSEIGLEVRQEKYHAKLFNVTDYMA